MMEIGEDHIRPAPTAPAAIILIVRLGEIQSRVAASQGDTLLVALKRAGLPLTSVCGGRAACGSCKLAVGTAWIDRLPPPEKAERRLLKHLPDCRDGDRLACQITLTATLDGLEIQMAA